MIKINGIKIFRATEGGLIRLHPDHIANAVGIFPAAYDEQGRLVAPETIRVWQDAEGVFSAHLQRAIAEDDISIVNGCYHNDVNIE